MTMDDWPAVHTTEVDGVPALWADVPGPMRAGLVLRVGRVDETYVTGGITHLLEHLALFEVGRPGDHSNGSVDSVTSHFHTTGDAASVRDFLATVTRGLADPPTDRLDDERAVLATERAGRRTGVVGLIGAWRWGAVGYGLSAGDELGVGHVTGDDVRAWAARYATRGNAALWLSGPPPAGLTLAALPEGPAMPGPDPRPSMLPELPAWFGNSDGDGIAMDAVVDRSWAASAVAHVLQSRLVDELRVRRAYAYSPQVDYSPLTAGAGRLLALTDVAAGRQTDALRVFLDIVEGLVGDRPPTEAEVDEWRAIVLRHQQEPLAPLGFVAGQAFNVITGYPLSDVAETNARLAEVSAQDVAGLMSAAVASSVLAVPAGVRMTRPRWSAAPSGLHAPVEGGRLFRPVGGGTDGLGLVAADEGLSRRFTDGTLTVRRDRAVGVLGWADGRRVVVADDGSRLDVEPTCWEDGRALVEHVDRVFPADLRVDMGTRRPDEIPRPAPSPAPPASATSPAARLRRVRPSTWLLLGVAALLMVGVVSMAATGSGTLGSAAVPLFMTSFAVQRVVRDLRTH